MKTATHQWLTNIADELEHLPLTYEEREEVRGGIQMAWNALQRAWGRIGAADPDVKRLGQVGYLERLILAKRSAGGAG